MTEFARPPHHHRILVVDDYEPLREAFKRMLETDGCSVQPAGTGFEALTALGEERPCLVFLDLALPDMTAQHVLQSIGPEGPPVVLISGDAESLAGAFSRAIAGTLVKPIDRTTLAAAVARHARCAVATSAA